MRTHAKGLVRGRQDPLRASYKDRPEDARITDRGRSVWDGDLDAFHGRIEAGSQDYGLVWPYGVHRAVGGDHDLPNPGDLLATALAACLDSALRMIADRNGVVLQHVEVDVSADVDVRGTLMVERDVPVGFREMRCVISVQAREGTDPALVEKIVAAAERSCVNLQTLRHGVPVKTTIRHGAPAPSKTALR